MAVGGGAFDVAWDDLRLCLAVVRAGTVSGAAQALGISHSTVLRRIAALERKIGVVLFAKKPNGYDVNDAGRALVATAEAIEGCIAEAVADVAGADRAMKGVLRIAVPDISGQALIGIVRQFAELHPDISIAVEVAQQPSSLTVGECHLALALTSAAPPGADRGADRPSGLRRIHAQAAYPAIGSGSGLDCACRIAASCAGCSF